MPCKEIGLGVQPTLDKWEKQVGLATIYWYESGPCRKDLVREANYQSAKPRRDPNLWHDKELCAMKGTDGSLAVLPQDRKRMMIILPRLKSITLNKVWINRSSGLNLTKTAALFGRVLTCYVGSAMPTTAQCVPLSDSGYPALRSTIDDRKI